MRTVCSRLEKAGECLEYFTGQEWQFFDDNSKNLNLVLSAQDRSKFPFDVSQINWDSFLEQYVLGIRTFIFREQHSSLPHAKRHLMRYVIRYIVVDRTADSAPHEQIRKKECLFSDKIKLIL